MLQGVALGRAFTPAVVPLASCLHPGVVVAHLVWENVEQLEGTSLRLGPSQLVPIAGQPADVDVEQFQQLD